MAAGLHVEAGTGDEAAFVVVGARAAVRPVVADGPTGDGGGESAVEGPTGAHALVNSHEW